MFEAILLYPATAIEHHDGDEPLGRFAGYGQQVDLVPFFGEHADPTDSPAVIIQILLSRLMNPDLFVPDDDGTTECRTGQLLVRLSLVCDEFQALIAQFRHFLGVGACSVEGEQYSLIGPEPFAHELSDWR